MIQVLSTFHLTPIVAADAQGPYTVNAGSPITLSAGATHPDATYEWDLGDGTTANTPVVTHSYADNGIYLAKLTVILNQAGGARSRHFAEIHALNVPPKVNAGPDRAVDEGDVVSFTGTFSDPEWPDTHEATWDWGDYQKPDSGVVAETHNPPAAVGTVSGSHAWGDNGVYTVTLTVRDDDGGVGEDTSQITVLNVPPTVEAGEDLFAYPCTVITLEGKFTDPGWLDTHGGTWDFGDCTPLQPAVVRETNDPPVGKGVAIASHVYHKCGTFHATCVVTDDDGGVGQDARLIHVVDVVNPGFESGFRGRRPGSVGNDWQLYAATIEEFAKPSQSLPPPPGTFLSEEFLVHGGQRSQRVRVRDKIRAGAYQRIGANVGWDYQITAWYSLFEDMGGQVRLGIDPAGGDNPAAASVVWIAGAYWPHWAQLIVRATATARMVTIFLEALGGEPDRDAAVGATGGPAVGPAGADACFDDVALLAVQPFCPEAKEDPEQPPRPEETCLSFTDLHPGAQLPSPYGKSGFTFHSLDKQPVQIVAWGVPLGQPKMYLRAGLVIDLPFPSEWVRVKISQGSQAPVTIKAVDAGNQAVASATTPTLANQAHTVEIAAPGMVRLYFKDGGRESGLIEICARRDPKAQRDPRVGQEPQDRAPRDGPQLSRASARPRAPEAGGSHDEP